MGRPLRIFIPGYAYHIIARGNERKDIFRDNGDREKFLQIMEKAKEKFQITVFAYVLMSNHYHFLAEIKLPNMSQAMQYINTSYGIYFNRKYKRSGHFLQGRFQAIVVEHGQDLKFVTAYIHLNPARAGMVERVIEYPWSSHRQYTGRSGKGIAEPARVLRLFNANRKEAIKKYEKYLKETAIRSTDDNKRARIYGDYVMGSESFVRNIKLMFKDKKLPEEIVKRRNLRKIYNPDDIIKAASEYYKVKEKELLYKKGRWNRGKRILIYLLGSDAGMPYASISRMLDNLNSSSIGRVYRKVTEEIEKNRRIRMAVSGIRKKYAGA